MIKCITLLYCGSVRNKRACISLMPVMIHCEGGVDCLVFTNRPPNELSTIIYFHYFRYFHSSICLLSVLFQMFSLDVKEQAACALWSLAGQTKTQQRNIAEKIGIQMLIEILLRDSEKLQFVGVQLNVQYIYKYIYIYIYIYIQFVKK